MNLYAITRSIPYEVYNELVDMSTDELTLSNKLAWLLQDEKDSGFVFSETEYKLVRKDDDGQWTTLRKIEWRNEKWNVETF
jgi:hypothetical protein